MIQQKHEWNGNIRMDERACFNTFWTYMHIHCCARAQRMKYIFLLFNFLTHKRGSFKCKRQKITMKTRTSHIPKVKKKIPQRVISFEGSWESPGKIFTLFCLFILMVFLTARRFISYKVFPISWGIFIYISISSCYSFCLYILLYFYPIIFIFIHVCSYLCIHLNVCLKAWISV